MRLTTRVDICRRVHHCCHCEEHRCSHRHALRASIWVSTHLMFTERRILIRVDQSVRAQSSLSALRHLLIYTSRMKEEQ